MATHVPFTSRRLSKARCDRDGGHSRSHAATFSGLWECTLEVVTPLCIRSYFEQPAAAGLPLYIPGSSIRGMVRSVVEMLGASCGRRQPPGTWPEALRPCSAHSTCIGCRVFGFVQGPITWQGKISVGDTKKRTCTIAGMPLPPTGGTTPAAPAGGGWRVFPHELPAAVGGALSCAAIGEVFEFQVRYEDLSREEYDVLKFALTLQSPGVSARLCHKLGYSKERGLGSCIVSILHDASPAVSAGIDPYVNDPAFAVFVAARTC